MYTYKKDIAQNREYPKQANGNQPHEERRWCAATEALTVYKNDKGFFTRKAKKVDEDWKALFIPVYFADETAFAPVAEKTELIADIHWILIGQENLKLAIKVDKIHSVGKREENV